MNKTIYFDNAATTMVCKEAADKAYDIMTEKYGNPSSVHSFGSMAAKELAEAREVIREAIGFCRDEGELYFTSSGTEAANIALFGAARSYARRGKRILVSDSEHPCVYKSAIKLRDEGFDVVFIPTKGGFLDLDFAESNMNEEVILISAMTVNNETGSVYDISAIDALRKKKCPEAILHTDGVQGFLKTDAPLALSGADLISISSHKIHAPKGSGALWVKKGVRLSPVSFGGEQEKSLRPGTEALPNICAFSEAARLFGNDVSKRNTYVKELREYTKMRLLEECTDVSFNEGKNPSPYILSAVIHGIRSEIMLRFLSEKGIYVSAGSACSSKHRENRVLTAFGLSPSDADFTIRISFSEYNTKEEADFLAKSIGEGQKKLIPVKVFNSKRTNNR